MAERFVKVFTLTPNLYSIGCPIVIEAGALQKDTETGNLIAQLKMKNIGDKDIASCKVSLRARENNGHEVEGVKDFSYLDLNARPGDEFGSKTPIFLPEATARSFSVTVEEIVFADNSVSSTTYSEWKQIPQQETVSVMLDSPDLTKQYEIEVGAFAKYVPQITDGLFLCTCGSPNLKINEKCYRCGNTYEYLTEHLYNQEQLSENAKVRQAKEEEEKIVEENKKKKTRKLIIIAAIIAAIVICGIIVLVNHHKANTLPFEVGDPYETASELMKANASDFDYGYSASTCYGWFDYFGTGDNLSQYVRIDSGYGTDEDVVETIKVDVLSEYQTEVPEKIQRIYGIDPDTITVDYSDNTINMANDEVKITIETGYSFKETAEHNPGEEIFIVTIEKK